MEKLELNERQDETLNKYIQHGKLLLSFTAHKTHKYIDRYEYIKSEKKNSDAENMMTKKYNTESHIHNDDTTIHRVECNILRQKDNLYVDRNRTMKFNNMRGISHKY